MSENRQVPEGWGLSIDVTVHETRKVPLEEPNDVGNTFYYESRISAEYPEQGARTYYYPDRECILGFVAVILDASGRRVEKRKNSKDWPDFQWGDVYVSPNSGLVQPRFIQTTDRNSVPTVGAPPIEGGFFVFTLSANYGGEINDIKVSGQVKEGMPGPAVSNDELISENNLMLRQLLGA